jgi:lipoprotein-releasing system permease protein
MAIDDVRRIFGAGSIKATGVELKLDDPGKADAVSDLINEELAAPYQALTWSELNRDLFEALSLEKLVFSIIMGILVVVAAFNIIGVLVLLISFRAHEVAILKALGMRTGILRKIFTRGGIVRTYGDRRGLILGIAMALPANTVTGCVSAGSVFPKLLLTFMDDMRHDILFLHFYVWMTSRMAAKRLAN